MKLLAREESEAKEAALLALSACTASAAANCRLVDGVVTKCRCVVFWMMKWLARF